MKKKLKVRELRRVQLDYWVARALGAVAPTEPSVKLGRPGLDVLEEAKRSFVESKFGNEVEIEE